MQLLRWLVLPAMLVFLGVGCGDDDQPAQQDAAVQQQDAAIQDDATPVQDDAAVQDDAGPPPQGVITITQVTPQPTGGAYDGLKLPLISPSWDVGTLMGDHPTNSLDKRSGPIGCYAMYYKLSATDQYRPSTFSAGTVKVSSNAAWHSGMALSITDAGPTPGAAIPNPVECNRVETVADGGLFEYQCTGMPLMATAFLEVGDRIYVEGGGPGFDVPFFAVADAGAPVAIPPHVTTTVASIPALYAIGALFQGGGGDGGVTLEYQCGTTDGGTAAPCSSVLGILIESSDVAPPPGSMMPAPYATEYGFVQCSQIGGGTKYTITEDLWLTAFPPEGQWKTLRTAVTHLSLNTTPQLGMGAVIGVGGGEIGLYSRPDGG